MSFNLKKVKIAPKKTRKSHHKNTSDRENKSIETIHQEKLDHFEKLLQETRMKNARDVQTAIQNLEDEKNAYLLNVIQILEKYSSIEPDEAFSRSDNLGVSTYHHTKKIQLTKEFYNVLGMTYKENKKESEVCQNCRADLSIVSEEHYLVCQECGTVGEIVECRTLSYKEKQELYYMPDVHYKRDNYYKEWLDKLQARGPSSAVSQDIIDQVIVELDKEHVKDFSKINYKQIRTILKKLKLSKYYEDIPLIIYKINGIRPLRIPENIERKLKDMYYQIQQPFDKHKHSMKRHNFFSVPYITYKFCELLELHDYFPYLSLLKSRRKLYEQDQMWKNVVEELQKVNPSLWKFIPTVG